MGELYIRAMERAANADKVSATLYTYIEWHISYHIM